MQQRDILKDQIEQLGRVLGKIIAEFLSLKNRGDVLEAFAITNEALKNSLDLDIDALSELSPDALKNHLGKSNLVATHFDSIANYLYELAVFKKQEQQEDQALKYLKTAEVFIEVAATRSDLLTFERIELENKIKKLRTTLP